MSWFNDVTGTNDYERQSWRDNFNGGEAAGDLTGNVNRQLDAERAAFQGATWSGSSSQYSALEWAQVGGGVSRPQVGASATAGPGNPSVGNAGAPAAGPGAAAASPTRVITVSPGKSGGKIITKDGGISLPGSPTHRYLEMGTVPWLGPISWEVAGGYADAQDVEDIYGDDLGALPFIVTKLAYDTALNSERVGKWAGKPFMDAGGRLSTAFPFGVDANKPMAPMGKPASLNW